MKNKNAQANNEQSFVKRKKGLEPSTLALARLYSTN